MLTFTCPDNLGLIIETPQKNTYRFKKRFIDGFILEAPFHIYDYFLKNGRSQAEQNPAVYSFDQNYKIGSYTCLKSTTKINDKRRIYGYTLIINSQCVTVDIDIKSDRFTELDFEVIIGSIKHIND